MGTRRRRGFPAVRSFGRRAPRRFHRGKFKKWYYDKKKKQGRFQRGPGYTTGGQRLPMLPGIAPKKAMVNFKMCTSRTITGDATNKTQDTVFALTDPTDFLVGSGAFQPNGWEEWSAFYGKWRCVTASVTFRLYSTTTTNNQPIIGLLADDSNASLSSTTDIWTDWCQWPKTQHRIMRSNDTDLSGTQSVAVLRYHVNPTRFFEVPARDDDLTAVFPDASPAKAVFLHLLLSQFGDAVVPATTILRLAVTVNWKVMLFDRKNLDRGTDS